MKLINKSTGEIGKLHCDMNVSPAKYGVFEDTDIRGNYWEYDSLAELNSEWEDYTPKEPLIKDEKIRKAVRAWAEVNEYDKLWVYHDNDAISFYNEDDDDNEIIFNTVKKFGLKHLKCYTVEELCGEEEE